MHAAMVGKQARPEDACMKTCFIHFCKQVDRSCTLHAVNVRHFVLSMLGLCAWNSEWNSWYATAIICKQYKLFINSTKYIRKQLYNQLMFMHSGSPPQYIVF